MRFFFRQILSLSIVIFVALLCRVAGQQVLNSSGQPNAARTLWQFDTKG